MTLCQSPAGPESPINRSGRSGDLYKSLREAVTLQRRANLVRLSPQKAHLMRAYLVFPTLISGIATPDEG
jgi:hypothetical protein